MAWNMRGRMDGTGPYRGSYRRQVLGEPMGLRQQAGFACPAPRGRRAGGVRFDYSLNDIRPMGGRYGPGLRRGVRLGRPGGYRGMRNDIGWRNPLAW